MKILNLLFESSEVVKQKAIEIEKSNIIALKKSNQEFKELFKHMHRPKKHKIIYVHEAQHSYLKYH